MSTPINWPSKRPGEIDDRGLDWKNHLATSETISDSGFTMPSTGTLVLDSKSSDGVKVIGRFSGGAAGERPVVIGWITTSTGRRLEQAAVLPVENISTGA